MRVQSLHIDRRKKSATASVCEDRVQRQALSHRHHGNSRRRTGAEKRDDRFHGERTEGRRQKAGDRRQKAEGRRQKWLSARKSDSSRCGIEPSRVRSTRLVIFLTSASVLIILLSAFCLSHITAKLDAPVFGSMIMASPVSNQGGSTVTFPWPAGTMVF